MHIFNPHFYLNVVPSSESMPKLAKAEPASINHDILSCLTNSSTLFMRLGSLGFVIRDTSAATTEKVITT